MEIFDTANVPLLLTGTVIAVGFGMLLNMMNQRGGNIQLSHNNMTLAATIPPPGGSSSSQSSRTNREETGRATANNRVDIMITAAENFDTVFSNVLQYFDHEQ